MQLWPFIPESNVQETLEWKTEVLRSKAGEQRIALRFYPRTTLSMDYILESDEYFLSSLLVKKHSLELFLLPFWKEGISVGSLDSADEVINLDTTPRRFKDKALILDNDDSYLVVDITQMDSGSLTLSGPLNRPFVNGFVVPLGEFKISRPLEIKKGSMDYYEAKARFVSTDAYDYQGSIGFPQHLGEYVMVDKPIVNSELSDKFQREFTVLDNTTGQIWYSPDFDYPISTSEMFWHNISPEELYQVRHWLSEMKGKQGQFWIPSWNKDFVLTQDILAADDFLMVKDNNIRDYLAEAHVAIFLKDGTQYFRKVTSIEFDIGFEKLSIDPLGSDILASQVDRISLLTLMRSDADKINIKYLPSGNSQIKIPLMEVPHGL